MNTATFEELVEKLRPFITKQTTRLRKPISAEEQVAITIRYLATGESYESLQYQFRVEESTISGIIPQVCKAIYIALKEEYMPLPNSQEEWLRIAKATQDKWQFPNCFWSS